SFRSRSTDSARIHAVTSSLHSTLPLTSSSHTDVTKVSGSADRRPLHEYLWQKLMRAKRSKGVACSVNQSTGQAISVTSLSQNDYVSKYGDRVVKCREITSSKDD